jgi:hypothetical protein
MANLDSDASSEEICENLKKREKSHVQGLIHRQNQNSPFRDLPMRQTQQNISQKMQT